MKVESHMNIDLHLAELRERPLPHAHANPILLPTRTYTHSQSSQAKPSLVLIFSPQIKTLEHHLRLPFNRSAHLSNDSSSFSNSQKHMSRIHPSGGDGLRGCARRTPAVYTVWKRSSMGFQGTDGFSVYDAAGSLAFRVDNYSRRRKAFAGVLLLMDGHGTPLLSLRPQILSLHDRWNCYKAPKEGLDDKRSSVSQQQLFSMRKCSALQSTDEAEVYMSANATASGNSCQPQATQPQATPSFRIEGYFSRRSCKIRRSSGEEAARISRKNAGAASKPVALGDDVFSLVVRPGVDAATIMAIVVVMDRICRRPYTPLACSSQ